MNSITMLRVAVVLTFFSCTEGRIIEEPGNLVPKTVAEDLTLPTIQVNGASLHSLAFGPEDGPLFINIHGGPGANFKYMLNSKSLADHGYRVIFYDQRGSGLSERFSEEWYLDQGANAVNATFYDELKEVIEYYKVESGQKVYLFGQSWGAMLATGFAGKYPQLVDGLIVAEPGGLKWEDVLTYVEKSRSFGLWSEILNDATFLDQFLTGRKNQHEILDYKQMLLSNSNPIVGDLGADLGPNGSYYKDMRDGAVVSSVMFQLADKYHPDFSEGIAAFGHPVLFIYSGNNQAYPDSWARQIASAYPIKEIFKIQGVGHSGMVDQIEFWTNVTEPLILEYLNALAD